MIKKIQGFLNLMQEYSTPEGIQRLEDMVHDFAEQGGEEITRILDDQVDNFNFTDTLGHMPGAPFSLLAVREMQDDTTDVFQQVNDMLTTLLTALPSVLDNL